MHSLTFFQDINPIGGQPPILPPQPGFQNGQMGAPGLPPMGQTGLPMGQMGGPNGQFGQQNGQGMGGLNGQNGFGQNGMGNGQPMMN